MKFVNFKIENKKLIGVLANDENKIIVLNDLYADKTFCCMQDVIEQLNEDDIKDIQTKLDDENNNFIGLGERNNAGFKIEKLLIT